MSTSRSRRLLAPLTMSVAVAAACLLGAVAAAAGPSEPGAQPAWVNPDGTVDKSKMPDRLPVVGPDGRPLRDSAGRVIEVDPRERPARSNGSEQRRVYRDAEGHLVEEVVVEGQTYAELYGKK